MEDFELVISLTKNEYMRSTFVILSKVKVIRLIPVFLMIPILLKILTDVKTDSVSFWTYLLPLLPILIILILIYRVAQKSYTLNKDQLVNKKFQFSTNKLRIEVGEVSSEFPRSKIHKLTKSMDFLLIWTTKNSAQVLPKNQISAHEVQNVKNFCQK